MEQKINTNDISYLSFEGGGGKGIVYLGVVQALEEKYRTRIVNCMERPSQRIPGSPLPLFPIWTSSPEKRPLKGISGSSAGAITAFMLALGLSSEDVLAEIKKTTTGIVANKKVKLSKFEKFFEPADNSRYRATSGTKQHWNQTGLLKVFRNWAGLIKTAANLALGLRRVVGETERGHNILLKKLLLSDYREVQVYGSGKYGPSTKTFEYSLDTTVRYIHSLLFNRGIFSGFEVRKYFEELMDIHLFKKMSKLAKRQPSDPGSFQLLKYFPGTPAEVSFKWFFAITGVDLVITGVNVTTGKPLYFSLMHTPDFPVIEAVAISMNIPLLFKPVYNDKRVNFALGENDDYNMKYYGLFVDGGTTNNFPIHAFNNLKTMNGLEYQFDTISTKLAVPSNYPGEFRGDVLGFRLQSGESGLQSEQREDKRKFDTKEDLEKEIFKNDDSGVFGSYLGNLLSSVQYYAEKGQITTPLVAERTILIDTGKIEMLDFSSQQMNEQRGQDGASKEKGVRIKQAKDDVINLLL